MFNFGFWLSCWNCHWFAVSDHTLTKNVFVQFLFLHKGSSVGLSIIFKSFFMFSLVDNSWSTETFWLHVINHIFGCLCCILGSIFILAWGLILGLVLCLGLVFVLLSFHFGLWSFILGRLGALGSIWFLEGNWSSWLVLLWLDNLLTRSSFDLFGRTFRFLFLLEFHAFSINALSYLTNSILATSSSIFCRKIVILKYFFPWFSLSESCISLGWLELMVHVGHSIMHLFIHGSENWEMVAHWLHVYNGLRFVFRHKDYWKISKLILMSVHFHSGWRI